MTTVAVLADPPRPGLVHQRLVETTPLAEFTARVCDVASVDGATASALQTRLLVSTATTARRQTIRDMVHILRRPRFADNGWLLIVPLADGLPKGDRSNGPDPGVGEPDRS